MLRRQVPTFSLVSRYNAVLLLIPAWPNLRMRLKFLAIACFIQVAVCGGAPAWCAEKAAGEKQAPVVISDAARRLHRSALVFDGHNDLPWKLREQAGGLLSRCDIAQHQPKLQTDIPRLRQGGLGAQFWSVYVPAETSQSGTALRDTLEQIDLVYQLIARYPETFELAMTADDVERIHRQGKIASLIGVEGGHSIQESLGALRQLHKLGARSRCHAPRVFALVSRPA